MADEPLWVGAVRGDPWVAVAFDAEGLADATVHDGVGDLWSAYSDATRLLVDVPVGLPDAPRACDERARAVLGPRASAVLDPPVREAARKRRYRAAARAHERVTGASLSEAAFELGDAVAMVDELLAEVSAAREVLAPAHPELAFRAFAGEPLQHDPATAGGYAERLRTLAGLDRDAPPAVQAACEAVAGHPVTVEDVLAATALAYTARPGAGEVRSLPPDPPADERALPARWMYRADEPLAVDEPPDTDDAA